MVLALIKKGKVKMEKKKSKVSRAMFNPNAAIIVEGKPFMYSCK